MPSLQHTNVQMDNFLFSDDESLSQARPAAAVSRIDDDIVPDSSDEASTGPALEMPEMDLDREEGDDEELSYIAQQDENSYAHADASSNTRKAFKTSYVDREDSPATINPRDLAVGVSTSKAVETPQTRDSSGPDAIRYDTSITTTEVVPSEPDEASFTRVLSPADRPGMLGRELLQSASEIVKRRQRPKAKPLALASKEVRAAVRGESPPRDIEKASEKDKSNARKEKAAGHSEDDDDDELRLKTTKTKKTASDPGVSSAAVDTASGRVIDIDSDDTDEPLRRPLDGAKKAKAKTTKKGKSCQESEDDASAEERAYERMRREVEQANAKESEDDDDYGAKPHKAKGKRKKKEKEQAKKRTTRQDSVLLSEDTATEAPTRPSRTKGRPSAIFPSSKKGKSRASVDDNEDEDEEPVQVLSARKPSKATKDMKASTSKETHSKLQERAREDSVGAAKPTASLTCNHRSQTIMGKLDDPNGPVGDDSETDTLPLAPSSDASGSLSKAKVTKKYGKKAKKSALRIEESEEEEEPSDEANRTGVDGKTSDVTNKPPVSKGNGNDSRKTSGSSSGTGSKRLAFEVVIDNSARESRPVPRASGGHKAQGSHSGNGTSGLDKVSVEVAASVEGDIPASQPEDQEDRLEEDQIEQDLYKSAAQAPVNSTNVKSDARESVLKASDGNAVKTKVRAQDLVKSEQKLSTPAKILAGSGNSADVKSAVRSTGKRFHDMVVAKGGGQGIRSQGLSKRSKIPSLLSFRGVPPPKKPPLPPAPVRKKKKGEEVYSDDDLEELNDQPEDWWDADDYHAWEQRKRKRAKAKGEIDSDDERDLAAQSKKLKTEDTLAMAEMGLGEGEREHFSD